MMMMINSQQQEEETNNNQTHNQIKSNTNNHLPSLNHQSNHNHHHHHHNHQQLPDQMSTNNQQTLQQQQQQPPPPHHHHFYHPDPVTVAAANHFHHHHVHHHSQQQHHYHPVPPGAEYPPPLSPTSGATDLHGSLSSSTASSVPKRCCQSCRCSNRLVTGIIITILPIAITSTLICVFMMQKTNLHQYAIYSFVIFCVAFVFPFALFFFTVVINKLYKFYKREILATSPHATMVAAVATGGESCDSETNAAAAGYHLSGAQLSRVLVTNGHHHHHHLDHHHQHHQHTHHHQHSSPDVPQHQPQATQSAAGMITCARTYHQGQVPPAGPYYYQIQDGTVVAIAASGPGENATAYIIEDSPPSYEMALLCPSVVTHDPGLPSFSQPPQPPPLHSATAATVMQVILPQKEPTPTSKEKKITNVVASVSSGTAGSIVEPGPEMPDHQDGEEEEEEEDPKDPGEESTTSVAETSSSSSGSGSGTKEEPVSSHQTSQEEI